MIEYPGHRVHSKAIKDTQQNMIAALDALSKATTQVYEAAMPLLGTQSAWRFHAMREAIEAHVRSYELRNAIDAIMDDLAHRSITPNPTFTRPQG